MIDTYVDERDYKLLEADKYIFFVLKRIMGGECNLLLSGITLIDYDWKSVLS